MLYADPYAGRAHVAFTKKQIECIMVQPTAQPHLRPKTDLPSDAADHAIL